MSDRNTSNTSNNLRSVWVSYSGKDVDLVHALTRYTDQHGINETTPFKMLTYLRDSDDKPKQEKSDGSNTQLLEAACDSEKTTFLKPWQRLEDLIQTIGANLRRMIVLSNGYLDSSYCLQELMYCLVRKPLSPIFLLLIDFDGSFATVQNKRRYACLNNTEYTLAGALTEIYAAWLAKDDLPTEFRLPDDDSQANINAFFHQQLTELEKRLRTNMADLSQQNDHSLVQFNKDTQTLFRALSCYVQSFSYADVVKKYHQLQKQQIVDWLDYSQLGEHCQSKFSAERLFDIISKMDDKAITQFCQWLIKIKAKPADKQAAYEEAQQIASIILSGIIDPKWAAEIQFNSMKNNPVRIAQPETSSDRFGDDETLYIHIGLAAAKTHHIKFGALRHVNDPLEVKNVIELQAFAPEEDESVQNPTIMDLIMLVAQCSKEEAHSFKENQPRYKLRNRIRDFQEAFNFGDDHLTQISSALTLSAAQMHFDRQSGDIPQAFKTALEIINEDLIEDETPVQLGLLVLTFADCDPVVLKSKWGANKVVLSIKKVLEKYLND